MTKQWNRALVTGASAGIGRSFADLLAKQGTNLVVVARDTRRLELLAEALASAHSIEVEVLTADLSTGEGVERVAERLRQESEPIDFLVNNAGLGFNGDVIDIKFEQEQAMVSVNVVALHRLSYVAAEAMADKGGAILNVSSIAGFTPAPRTATYAATKAFVTSFSEALHVEMKPRKVVVSALCPGYTRTEFHERASYDVSRVPNFLFASAQAVAQAGLDAVATGKAVTVPGVPNKVAVAALKLGPRTAMRTLAARFT